MSSRSIGYSAFQAPDNWMPGRVAESLLVRKSDRVAVFVDGFAAYPAGFAFTITLVSRDPFDAYNSGALNDPRAGLRVRFADGTDSGNPGNPAQGLRLFPRGGSGSTSELRRDWWCAPLPPPGPVEFEVTLPDGEKATGSIEGALLVEASERAIQLWPDREVEPPTIDPRTAPVLPPPGPEPADPEAARQAIREAFLVALDHTEPSPDPTAAIQDGAALVGARAQARANHPGPAGTIRVAVGDIVFIDDVRAALVFQLNWNGAMTFGAQLGYAVFEEGRWKVARDTYCRVLSWAGVSCPPAPPPRPQSPTR